MSLIKRKRFWLGLAVTAVLLYLVFRQVDWAELAQALLSAQYGWMVPALAVYLFGYWLRAVRWSYLLNAVKPLSWQSLFPPLILGFMANNVLPARAGEFVPAYVVGKREGVSKAAVFATMIMQRAFDGLVMVLLAGVVLALFQVPRTPANASFVDLVNTVVDLTTLLFIVLFAFLFALITWKERAKAVLIPVIRVLPEGLRPKVSRLLDSFISGLAGLRNRKDSLLAFCFSLLAWLCESAAYYFVLLAFSLHVPVYAAVMLMAVVNLGIMLPSSPGYVGPFEFFGVSTLRFFSVEKSVSLPCILVIHALIWLPITLWGLYYMWTWKLSFHEIEETAASQSAPETGAS